jgi:hypothetical protein
MRLRILVPVSDERRTLHIDWVQLTAGALAAVSSAVLLSTVGVAGTLIGAVVGSVAVTLGNAVYSHYLALSKERVAAAKTAALVRAGHPSSAPTRLDAEPERAEQPAKVSWREAVTGLPWKRIAAAATAVFLLAVGAILAFELVTGRAVSTYTGGSRDHGHARTSIPGLGGGGDAGRDRTPEPTTAPSQGAPTTEGGTSPRPATPSAEPTTPAPSPAATTTAATPTPTPTTSATPTPSPRPELASPAAPATP